MWILLVGTGQVSPAQDAPELVITIEPRFYGSWLNLGGNSEFKINDKPARKLKDYPDVTNTSGDPTIFEYDLAVSDLKTGKNNLTINPR